MSYRQRISSSYRGELERRWQRFQQNLIQRGLPKSRIQNVQHKWKNIKKGYFTSKLLVARSPFIGGGLVIYGSRKNLLRLAKEYPMDFHTDYHGFMYGSLREPPSDLSELAEAMRRCEKEEV